VRVVTNTKLCVTVTELKECSKLFAVTQIFNYSKERLITIHAALELETNGKLGLYAIYHAALLVSK